MEKNEKKSRAEVGNTNGKIGELLVELELTKLGWHVERLDGHTRAVNGDLIAIKGRKRRVVQVKSSATQRYAFFGYAAGFLKDKTPFFNGKGGAIEADILVSVSGSFSDPSFHIFKIEDAERIAQARAISWNNTPTKTGKKRSESFPVNLRYDEVSQYLSNWKVLEDD